MIQNDQRPEKDIECNQHKKEEMQTGNRVITQSEDTKSFVFLLLPIRSTQEQFGRVRHHFPKVGPNCQPEFGLKGEDQDAQNKEQLHEEDDANRLLQPVCWKAAKTLALHHARA
jgi:hypothetical protein